MLPSTVVRVGEVFAAVAARLGLDDRTGVSASGLPERNLYSPDMAYRYGFGRWWGGQDLATTARLRRGVIRSPVPEWSPC